MTHNDPKMTRKWPKNDPKEIKIVRTCAYLFSSSVEIEVDEFEPSVSEALVPTESRISNLRPTFFNLILFSFWKLHPFFLCWQERKENSNMNSNMKYLSNSNLSLSRPVLTRTCPVYVRFWLILVDSRETEKNLWPQMRLVDEVRWEIIKDSHLVKDHRQLNWIR